MTSTSPTVGQIVWYNPETNSNYSGPLAAIITAVHTPLLVNLAVFTPNGFTTSRQKVYLSPPACPITMRQCEDGYAFWMPAVGDGTARPGPQEQCTESKTPGNGWHKPPSSPPSSPKSSEPKNTKMLSAAMEEFFKEVDDVIRKHLG